MCGRYLLNMTEQEVTERFGAREWLRDVRIAPRFNVAPTQLMPVVLAEEEGRRVATVMRWGFIAPWAKDLSRTPINARAETVAESRLFKAALAHRRCLVPATGFYEWVTRGKAKMRVRFSLKNGAPFAFAGLWSTWRDPTGEPVESFTILTTAPNALVAKVHDRMPAIVPESAYMAWLSCDRNPPEQALRVIGPYLESEMAATPVSTRVNSPAHDDASLLDPIEGQMGFDLS